MQLENFLLDNQEEYFKYSSRNYTPEQVRLSLQANTVTLSWSSYVFESRLISLGLLFLRLICLQRKYNNGLTRGLLELASEEGYVFEDFTFSMVRDRIRCYYKSHSQSAKKKRKR